MLLHFFAIGKYQYSRLTVLHLGTVHVQRWIHLFHFSTSVVATPDVLLRMLRRAGYPTPCYTRMLCVLCLHSARLP